PLGCVPTGGRARRRSTPRSDTPATSTDSESPGDVSALRVPHSHDSSGSLGLPSHAPWLVGERLSSVSLSRHRLLIVGSQEVCGEFSWPLIQRSNDPVKPSVTRSLHPYRSLDRTKVMFGVILKR